jgi:hypothetical protein
MFRNGFEYDYQFDWTPVSKKQPTITTQLKPNQVFGVNDLRYHSTTNKAQP